MSTSTVALEVPEAEDITTTDDILTVELSNGRTIPFPLEWSPRLLHASTKGKENWRLLGRGLGLSISVRC